MIIYSNKIVGFIADIKRIIRTVLSMEIRLKVLGDRFHDLQGKTSYPIKVVIYNNKNMLGYFEPDFYEIGVHERMMHVSRDQLIDLIRHELAHYMTFINHGGQIQPHGKEFQTFCQSMRWGETVSRATMCLEEKNAQFDIQGSVILRKIQKLMALSTSSNENEAEQALIKSQRLLLKHNMDSAYIQTEQEEKVFLKRIMKQKRENAKMRAIARILETFFVSTVYTRAGEYIYLEILGDAVNIEIAEYVSDVLQNKLEELWNQARRQLIINGAIAKNSFFLGIAKGYCEKIQNLKRTYGSQETKAVMVIEKQLADAQAMAYSRLRTRKSYASHCRESSALGEQVGRQLNINPALSKSAKQSSALLTYE